MTEQDIRLRRLAGQYLSAPAPAHTVARALCGLQAQYPQNALHALSLRTDGEGPAQARLVKSWTLRGTIHLFSEDDLPVYLGLTAGNRFRCNEWSAPSFWNQRPGWALTPARQAYFTDVIVEALSRGPLTRDTLREHCRARGMTEDEAASMFDSWGGGLRELCERGFVCYTAGPEKALRLCPPLEPLSAHTAQLTLARRYFTHYAPATIHDAMYFFHASAKAVRGWLAELPVHSAHCSGRESFWLDGEDAAPASPPECRFLAGFDPLMLGYEKKESLFLPPERMRSVFSLAGQVAPVLLLHGRVCGIWRRKGASIHLTRWEALSPQDADLVYAAAQAAFPGCTLRETPEL